MTVVDTSVLVAILKMESDAQTLRSQLRLQPRLVLPASCYLEAVMVLSADPEGRARLDHLLDRYRIAILPCDARQARLAADAFERFGKGRGRPAQLNFGDCLAYGAARANDAPLLFKGADFAATDVRTLA